MPLEQTVIEFFDIHDGEFICVQQREFFVENDVITDQILMSRKVALQLARAIIETLGETL